MVVWIYHSKRLLTLKYALWKATVISYLIQSLGAGDGTGPGWLLQVKCYFKFPFFLSEPFPEYQYKTSSGPITCHSWQDEGKTWPFFMEFLPFFDIFHTYRVVFWLMITILVLTASKRLLYIWIYSASTFNPYESFSSTVVTTGKTQIKKTAGWKVKVNKLNKTAGRKVKVDKTLALSPQLLHPPGLHLPGFCLLSSSLVQVTAKRGTSSLVRNRNRWTYCQVPHLGFNWSKYRRTCPGT